LSLRGRVLAISSVLNRLISMPFARQLHAQYFPGPTSLELAERAHRLGVEARSDTVRVIRDALELYEPATCATKQACGNFATRQAISVNLPDHPRRCQTEELWQLYNLRGEQLMARRGIVPPLEAERGFEVAAGS